MRRLVPALFFFLSLPAIGQQIIKKQETFAPDTLEGRAQKRCQENRGTDCGTREGLREWIQQEKPLTREQQQAAAAARRHRAECARNKAKPGC